MAGTIGRAFKIAPRDVKAYGYVKPPSQGRSYRKNPGVTAIAAVNGRGSYRGRARAVAASPSARKVMSGLQQNARRRVAKQLTESEREAFARRVQAAKKRGTTNMLRANRTRAEAGKTNIRKAQAARKAWGRYQPPGTRIRVGPSAAWHKSSLDYGAPVSDSYRGKLEPGVYTTNRRRRHRKNGQTAAQRLASLKNLRKARSAKRGTKMRSNRTAPRRRVAKRRAAPRRLVANRRRRPVARTRARTARLSPNRRRSTRRVMRRNGQTAAQRRASLKNLRKARAARMRPNRRRSTRRLRRNPLLDRGQLRRLGKLPPRPLRRNGQTAAQRRASLKNLRKARAARLKPNRRRSTRRLRKNRKTTRRPVRRLRRNGQTMAQRRASLRNLRKARAAQMRPNRRRSTRRLRKNGRRTTRRYRRNSAKGFKGLKNMIFGRKGFKKNGISGFLLTGATIGAGFLGHKLATHLLSNYVLDLIIPAPAAPVPAATSGLEMLYPYRGLISGIVTAGVGALAVNYLVKDNQTKILVVGGMAASLVQTGLVTLLEALGQSQVAGYLSGYENPTAARLSAMYGMGGSIMPRYAPIGQVAPYEASAGMGEYFESGVEGLGNYVNNPELMQAAAGMGQSADYQGTHIDPSSDLDQQMSIMEAAAGVGQVAYEAAAGMGEYLTATSGLGEYFENPMSGLGAVNTVPSANTWIPGTTNPQLWAGTRGVSRGQSATAMVPAGVLSTPGGAGILG